MRELALIFISLGAGFGLGVFWRSRFRFVRYYPPSDREERRKIWERVYLATHPKEP